MTRDHGSSTRSGPADARGAPRCPERRGERPYPPLSRHAASRSATTSEAGWRRCGSPGQIEATDAFALGLSLVPSGQTLNRTLGITPSRPCSPRFRPPQHRTPPMRSNGSRRGRTFRDRARFVCHKVFPPTAYMASSYPRATLAGRPARSPTRHAGCGSRRQLRPSLRAWREARRASRGSGPPATDRAARLRRRAVSTGPARPAPAPCSPPGRTATGSAAAAPPPSRRGSAPPTTRPRRRRAPP